MGGLDSRIVIIGLPTVARQLHADPEQLVWITQAYILASTVCLLTVGRIGDMYGRVKIYNWGFVIFTLGSALCSLATNPSLLIAFRIFQGVGTAMISTNSGAIITDAAPVKSLGLMLGINQMTLRVGSMAGLTISGLILTFVDWRGLFYVNIPIGIFGTIWAYKQLREISVREKTTDIDIQGFVSFTVSLSMILLGITFLGYGMSDALISYALLAIGFVLLGIFGKIESRSKSPMLDLRIFRNRVFTLANIAQLVNSLTWTGLGLMLAFYLQVALGYSPFQAGVGLLPVDIVYFASTLFSSRLSDRHGSKILATSGLAISAVAFLAITTFSLSTTYISIAAILVVFGLGNGLFNTPNTREIMSSVPPERRGVGSGIRQMMFSLGLTLSYGIVIVLITQGIPYSVFSQLLQGTISPSLTTLAKTEFMSGFRTTSLVFAILMLITIVPSWTRGKVSVPQRIIPSQS